MRVPRPAAALLVLLFCTSGSPAAPQQTGDFRAEVDLVNISAVVRSSAGSLLTDLKADDFEIFEDGVPQTVRFFARESNLPLTLGLAIDVSGSQEKFIKQHNRDVEAFVNAVVRPSDKVFTLCFGNHLRLLNDGVSNGSAVSAALERFEKNSHHLPELGPREPRDLGTALYDAVYFLIAERLAGQKESRRALLLFSDGEENSSEHDLLDAIEEAQNNNTFVYSIRYTGRDGGHLTARNKYGIRAMSHLARLTGGAEFDALSTSLPAIFDEIGRELRAMYELGYISSRGEGHDGAFRTITVHCKQRGATVRTRTGYYAK